MKKVAIFGSTGSIGTSTLNVIRENKEDFEAITLVAGKNIEKLIEQIDLCDTKGVEISNNINKKITLRDYELIILRLFNMQTKPKYERFPLKEKLFSKVSKELEQIPSENFLYANFR